MSQKLKMEIADFWEMDENSRMCPGMKETVTFRDRDGKSEKHQKRLVLTNLKELYAAWSESHLIRKLDFLYLPTCHQSGCVLAGAYGTHSVCVCKYY